MSGYMSTSRNEAPSAVNAFDLELQFTNDVKVLMEKNVKLNYSHCPSAEGQKVNYSFYMSVNDFKLKVHVGEVSRNTI